MVDPNTRQGKRTPVTLKIKFKSETLEQFIERYAVDVSQGGIFIRTKEPLAVGTQMKFEFQLRDASPLIAGEGTVVWTRENDPSRPAIAPGMGVRFDRLADGSQGILERILAEKAKQAPQRTTVDTMKPPLFTDTPTRVAPTPMQEALLGKDNGRARRTSEDPGQGDSHTPLPKPMPFHSDADEFPDEAFEEATKVRALDELIAQTADGALANDEPSRRNGQPISDRAETLTEPIEASLARRERTQPTPARPAATTKPPAEIYEAPDLPNPPELAARPQARLLDTSPSPRIEAGQPFVQESLLRTRPGVEPARGRVSSAPPSLPPPSLPPPLADGPSPAPLPPPQLSPMLDAPPPSTPLLPSLGMRSVPTEHTEPARMPALPSKSNAPIIILALLVVAAAAAAVWFFVFRPKAIEDNEVAAPTKPEGSAGSVGSAIATAPTLPPPTGATGSGSGAIAAPGSAATTAPPAPAEPMVDTVIGSSAEGAQIEVKGTDQSGPAPFTAKLEKGKPYQVRITAHGFAALEMEVKGGDSPVAKMYPKPHVISVASEPSGALIAIDGAATGHTTPFDVELSASQLTKKSVRVQIRKSGFKSVERVVELAKLTEDDSRMVATIDEKLATQPTQPSGGNRPSGGQTGQPKPPTPPSGEGSDTGSAAEPPAAPPTTPSSGSDQPVTAPSQAPTPPPSSTSNGSAADEPAPDFSKQQQ